MRIFQNSFCWFWAALVVCWLDLFLSLEKTWSFDPQYYYGYLIPLAGGFLFWRAWCLMPKRMEPAAVWKGEWVGWLVGGFLWLLLTALLEVYVYGRLFLWGKAGLALGVTIFFLWRQGGWPGVRSMIFILLFLMLAVPWPTRIEGPVVGGLALVITTVTVDILNVMGMTALQQGRLIEFGGSAPLGVEEACSGIRSLQLSLAFSFYFGELQRMAAGRRLALIAGGVALAFVGNLIRTLGLSYVVIQHGMEHFDFWHDVLGGVVIAIVLGGIWWLGSLLGNEAGVLKSEVGGHIRELLSADRWSYVGIVVAVPLMVLCVQGWFILHERNYNGVKSVQFDWQQIAAEVELSSLPEAAQDMLGYSTAQQGIWQDPLGRRWIGAFVLWEEQLGALASKLHRPDVCLRAAGHDLLEYHDSLDYQKEDLQLEVKCYSFRSYAGNQFYVFYAFWMEGGDSWSLEMGSLADYLHYVLKGIRFQGAQMIQIYAPSGLTEHQAKAWVVNVLDNGLSLTD